MLRILFLVLPPHKKYFIFVINLLKGEIIYLPYGIAQACKKLAVSERTYIPVDKDSVTIKSFLVIMTKFLNRQHENETNDTFNRSDNAIFLFLAERNQRH